MPISPPVACRFCQRARPCECDKVPPPAEGEKSELQKKQDSEHDRLVRTSRWKNQSSPTCRSLNPICQRLLWDGFEWKQCTNPSQEVHHISADLSLFWKPWNWAALCREHHHKGQGDSDIGEERYYSPTKWLMGSAFEHPAPPPPDKPGQRSFVIRDGVAIYAESSDPKARK